LIKELVTADVHEEAQELVLGAETKELLSDYGVQNGTFAETYHVTLRLAYVESLFVSNIITPETTAHWWERNNFRHRNRHSRLISC
jgi:hypothetical protein